MTTHQVLTVPCLVCSGTGTDPGFGDACAPCSGTGRKNTAVRAPETRLDGITAKQIEFASKLATELGRPGHAFGHLTKKQASALIDSLLAEVKVLRSQPKPKAAPVASDVTDGLYVLDGATVKIQHTREDHTRLYGKVWDTEAEAFEYAPGMVAKLDRALKAGTAHRMSLDEASAFGHLYGVCCVCSRELTDEVSIAAGIGPICARKF